ncbi:uncharacterized protein BO88DRAFT_344910 [Aspergillus vadensis CBS 113365]|uniref:Uncharacterized protein n=1 Tax=Aspergillus vadensis (strain CBS 113365 / IMI 142717 / IBT 24658) TaxID=1448311 RepID=A0A319B587_ASPVC|nr:hypothetical protein BO88DRAFT_344910 [Aspergillus vadensis CBS 113365]PYH67051.1 hypothetical protein BO88DRAFT_344910 [Aspergillus vadensis CBS 113365]
MSPFSSPAVPVQRDHRTLPAGHPQSAAELGVLPTSPDPPPVKNNDEDDGSISSVYLQSPSAGNSIEINTFSNIERNSNSFLHGSHHLEDSINDLIILNTTTTTPSYITNVIDTGSNSHQQKKYNTGSKY